MPVAPRTQMTDSSTGMAMNESEQGEGQSVLVYEANVPPSLSPLSATR